MAKVTRNTIRNKTTGKPRGSTGTRLTTSTRKENPRFPNITARSTSSTLSDLNKFFESHAIQNLDPVPVGFTESGKEITVPGRPSDWSPQDHQDAFKLLTRILILNSDMQDFPLECSIIQAADYHQSRRHVANAELLG